MTPLTEKVKTTAPNALGHDTTFFSQKFRVDSHHWKPNYLGYGKPDQQVCPGDHIIVYTDASGWTCWVFSKDAEEL